MGQSHTSPIGQVAWANVISPKFNDLSKKWVYDVGLIISEADAMPLWNLVQKAMEDKIAKDPRWGQDPTNLGHPIKPSLVKDAQGNKHPDPGKLLISFKSNAEIVDKRGAKTPAQPPRLYDSRGQVIPPGTISAIPWGSQVKVVFDVFAYDQGAKGVSFGLRGLQLILIAEEDVQLEPVDMEGAFVLGQVPGAPEVQPIPMAQPVAAAVPAVPAQQPAPWVAPELPAQAMPVAQAPYVPAPVAAAPAAAPAAVPAAPVQAGPMPVWPGQPQPPAQAPSILDQLRGIQ